MRQFHITAKYKTADTCTALTDLTLILKMLSAFMPAAYIQVRLRHGSKQYEPLIRLLQVISLICLGAYCLLLPSRLYTE